MKTVHWEMFFGLTLTLCALFVAPSVLAYKSSGDTSNAATDFTFHGKGQWWHDIGPATELTAYYGPFRNATGHPAEIYMTFWKEPDADAHDGLSPALDPKSITVLHSLGTTFYYPAKDSPPPDPTTYGYTADDFANADRIFAKFPSIEDLFPKGYSVVGCQNGSVQYFLVQPKDSSTAFLVDWVPKDGMIDVAVMPAKVLKGPFESVLDNLNYYSSGGMVELMDFAGHYYYLSRLPQSSKLDPLASGTAASSCPDTPVASEKGIEYPKSWIDAMAAMDKQKPKSQRDRPQSQLP